MLLSLCLAAGLFVSTAGGVAEPTLREAAATLYAGEYAVTVNAWGVLTAVPRGGLVTVDGPPVHLADDFAEWFGVSFEVEGERGVRRGVGPGRLADWAGRPVGEVVGFSARAESAESIVRCGDLRVVTRLRFDPLGTYLLVSVEATNVGAGRLLDVHYSREWSSRGEPGLVLGEAPSYLLAAPDGVTRYFYDELYSLGPGESRSIGWSYAPPGRLEASAGGAVDVPLALWTSPSFPLGFDLGLTNGTSFGDYDGDGWIDIVVCYEGKIWRNLGGVDWLDAVDLDAFLPPAVVRYGSSLGDYDADGLPDIVTEPRRTGLDDCVHVLRNEGGGLFTNIATDPNLVDFQPCAADSETAIWADVDGDRDLDLFVPIYPAWFGGGPGNAFFQNMGPTGPGGEHRFEEKALAVGLKNPPGSSKPEGAQACDWDSDGDVDVFSNSTFYQNLSTLDAPRFEAMDGDVSGLILNQFIDEGAAFFDYDMDGDFDLFLAFLSGVLGNVVMENRGDGTFFGGEAGIIESPYIGIGLGLSVADWDNDGDVDYTTRQVFRRNMMVETGQRKFVVATHAIDPTHLTSATPAWGDWDRDGDLDSALGNYGPVTTGKFYDNLLYDGSTSAEARRYVRVRPVADSALVPAGLETEFGATAEIRIEGDARRRRAHVASGHGYLNQNEYALHFGLPPDPFPGVPAQDLELTLSVDFPNLPSDGFWRVDEHVNPVLAELDLGALADREIDVFRSGAVSVNGCRLAPVPSIEPRLFTTTGGLVLPDPTVVLPPPAPTATKTTWVGIELDTFGATKPVRMTELILDGELGRAVDCGGQRANVALWDVTAGTPPPGPGLIQVQPQLGWVKPGPVLALNATTSPRNHRTTLAVDALLEPNRTYRLVARVRTSRGTPIAGPVASGPITVRGGLAFDNPSPCKLDALLAAPVDGTRVFLAFRFRTEFAGTWTDVGAGQPGIAGVPVLRAVRVKQPVQAEATLVLTNAKPNASVLIVFGDDPACKPFGGVTLVPSSSTVTFAQTDSAGRLVIEVTHPLSKSSFFQMAVMDGAAANGLAVSNCLVRRGP